MSLLSFLCIFFTLHGANSISSASIATLIRLKFLAGLEMTDDFMCMLWLFSLLPPFHFPLTEDMKPGLIPTQSQLQTP